jgi:hypothetical protein
MIYRATPVRLSIQNRKRDESASRRYMSKSPTEEVISDLFRHLELLETQSAAVLQFLKDEGIATSEQIAPYLEQAASASSVKWRAARARMEHLFSVSEQATAKPSNAKVETLEKKEPEEKKAADKKEKSEDGTQSGAAKDHAGAKDPDKEVDGTKLTAQPTLSADKQVAAKPEAGNKTTESQSKAADDSQTVSESAQVKSEAQTGTNTENSELSKKQDAA